MYSTVSPEAPQIVLVSCPERQLLLSIVIVTTYPALQGHRLQDRLRGENNMEGNAPATLFSKISVRISDKLSLSSMQHPRYRLATLTTNQRHE